MLSKSPFLGLAMLCVLLQTAAASSVAIAPTKDNTLIQQTSASGQLSNGLGDLFVGRTNQDGQGTATISIRRGLVEFTPPSLPLGATITGVTLTVRDVMGLNGASTIELHDLLQDWGEGTSFQNGGMGAAATNGDATWLYTFFNQANPTASPTWATAGGSYSPTVSASAVDNLGAGGFFTWSSATSPQMLADVQNWIANPSGNFGWIILGNESAGQTARRFNGRESTISPNVPPMLTLNYVVPEPSTAILAVIAVLGLALTQLGGARVRLNRC